jgi:hypothetical protein
MHEIENLVHTCEDSNGALTCLLHVLSFVVLGLMTTLLSKASFFHIGIIGFWPAFGQYCYSKVSYDDSVQAQNQSTFLANI